MKSLIPSIKLFLIYALMKYLYCILFLTLISCKQEPKNISPKTYLNAEQQQQFKLKIIRYIDRLPKYATETNKFESRFDEEYLKKASDCELLFYFKNTDNSIYFAISKIAPSMKIKKTATVGKIKLDAKNDITSYEEVFRTWKMEPKELEEKTEMLFRKLINDEDLTAYYTKNSNPEFYIEFPDDNTFYDTISRNWKTK